MSDHEEEWSSGIHPDDVAGVMAAVQAHFEEETEVFQEEYRVRCKDGSYKWILDRGVARRDAAGNVVRMAGSGSDITDRKRAEEKLRDSEIKSRALLEGSPVCNKILDLDSRLQYMSSAGVQQLKIPDIESFYGRTYPSFLYPDSVRAPLVEHLERAKAGETCSVECPLLDADGCEVWYHTTFVPARDDQGRIEFIIATSVNITERKRAEEDARVTRAQLEHVAMINSIRTGVARAHRAL